MVHHNTIFGLKYKRLKPKIKYKQENMAQLAGEQVLVGKDSRKAKINRTDRVFLINHREKIEWGSLELLKGNSAVSKPGFLKTIVRIK